MSIEVQSKLDSAFGISKRACRKLLPTACFLTSDHVTNFFYNNAPMFCLGVSDTCTGPGTERDGRRFKIFTRDFEVDTTMAKGCLIMASRAASISVTPRKSILDHAFMVPLSLLTPHMDLPIVPLHINGMLPPRPTAARCYRLGQQSPITSAITTMATWLCSPAAAFPAISAAPKWLGGYGTGFRNFSIE